MIAYARPVDGGFEIVGYSHPVYHVTELPKFCMSSGVKVVLDEKKALLILEIIEKREVILREVLEKIEPVFNDMFQKLLDAKDAVFANPNCVETRKNHIARLFADAWLSETVREFLQPAIDSSKCHQNGAIRLLQEMNGEIKPQPVVSLSDLLKAIFK